MRIFLVLLLVSVTFWSGCAKNPLAASPETEVSLVSENFETVAAGPVTTPLRGISMTGAFGTNLAIVTDCPNNLSAGNKMLKATMEYQINVKNNLELGDIVRIRAKAMFDQEVGGVEANKWYLAIANIDSKSGTYEIFLDGKSVKKGTFPKNGNLKDFNVFVFGSGVIYLDELIISTYR